MQIQTKTQDTKDFTLIEQSNGNWIVKCCHCGATATYTNEITAQINVPLTPHCSPANIPFMGEPVEVEDNFDNGLAVGVDY